MKFTISLASNPSAAEVLYFMRFIFDAIQKIVLARKWVRITIEEV